MAKEKVVHCRYTKCSKLHDSTELKKEDAIQGGNGKYYYHPDCYHTLQTVLKTRDLFIKEVNPIMTGQQIGILVSTINNMIFNKGIDADYILFALQYFVRYKPGKLRQPYGMHYIVQDKDVVAAWKKEQERKARNEIKKQQEKLIADELYTDAIDLYDAPVINYNQGTKSKFSSILGV